MVNMVNMVSKSASADRKEQSRQYFIAGSNILVDNSIKLILFGDLICGNLENGSISIDFIIRDERFNVTDLKVPNKKYNIIGEPMFNCLSAIQSPFERIRCSRTYAGSLKQFKIGASVNISVPDINSPKIYGFIRVIDDFIKGRYFGVEVLSEDKNKPLDEILSVYDDVLLIETKTRPFIKSLQFETENPRSTRVYARINVLQLCDVSRVELIFNWLKGSLSNSFWSTSHKQHEPKYRSIAEGHKWIRIGDEIEVQTGIYKDTPNYIDGKVVWIGQHVKNDKVLILIETCWMNGDTDGFFDGHQYFNLSSRTGKFVDFENCYRKNHFFDQMTRRVEEASLKESTRILEEDISETVEEYAKPILFEDFQTAQKYCGMKKGIQGHINSCYMDATLFSVFASTTMFDKFLICNRDDPAFEKVRMILSTEIVYPLRKFGFVAQSKVTQLRCCLSDLLNDPSFISDEKDPEEFLSVLLGKVFNYDVKLKLSSNQETYCFQLFAEKNEKWEFPTVEQLFKQSMITNKLKIAEIPEYLILQMPRYGTEFKMYNNIFPSPIIDLSDLVTDYPRRCNVCGEGAVIECLECFDGPGISFCENDYERTHSDKNKSHTVNMLSISPKYKLDANNAKLELLSVICIETSHYVSFTKMGSDSNTWVFFDSMAQRVEGAIGRNTPSVTICNSLRDVLNVKRDKLPTPNELRDLMTKRLVRDVYYCIYQNRNTLL